MPRRRRSVGPLVAGSVHRQGAHRLPVEPAPEADHLVLARRVLRQAEGAFHRLRAARVQLDAVDAFGRQLRHLIDQLRARGRAEAAHRHLLDLGVQRLLVGGVAMAERIDADAADQIDVAVPVDVLDHRALGPLDRDAAHQRETLQTGREVLLLPLSDLAALRARDLRLDVGRGELQAALSGRKPFAGLRFWTLVGRARARLHCHAVVSKLPRTPPAGRTKPGKLQNCATCFGALAYANSERAVPSRCSSGAPGRSMRRSYRFS